MILIIMFSLIFDVIQKNNEAGEYDKIGFFTGGILTTLRLSLGDFDFNFIEKNELDNNTHILFWILWFMMVVFSSLIFLNFIIAEVCNSYAEVRSNIDAFIYKERASLIAEAEDIMSNKSKTDKNCFPTFIISR